ncbi:MAG: glycoside hydrolase family 38 C-terminal domain-containing protein [Opitutaceae bacterium]|nr:glycoside hydrolase family 38 C-terminal domain-containing protein [Opitutaceae bacterium]
MLSKIVRHVLISIATAMCLGAAPEQAKVRIISLEPTALFPNREPLCQIGRLNVDNPQAETIECTVRIRVNGVTSLPAQALKLTPNNSQHDVLIPDIASTSEVELELFSGAKTLATHKQTWKPQRKWKVFIVKSSHEDIGYDDYVYKKQRDIANFIDLGRQLSERVPPSRGSGGGIPGKYHYTMETMLFQRNYIEERGEKAWRELVEKDIKTGNMSLMGAPSGVHSHWMDYEELARMAYPGRREAKDRFGLDLNTFMIVDNPSLSWSAVQVLAEAGFKYVARWGMGWRTGGNHNYRTTKLPALFWWQGPDGQSRVLFAWREGYGRGFWYGQTGGGRHQIDAASGLVSETLKQIESGSPLGPYPYDALVTPEYVDHDIPHFDKRVLRDWANRYAYPQLRIASPTDFFSYIEATYGNSLPVLSGDLNNFAADYATIDPESQGWKRRAARLLPVAEGLAALAGSIRSDYLLQPDFVERTYTRMFDYDEHGWPTQPPVSDIHLFNAHWVKKHEAKRALDAAETAFQGAAAEFGRNIVSGEHESFAVFNPLVRGRSGVVETKGDFAAVIDLQTGQRISTQTLPEGKILFVAHDVPAYGYKVYQIARTLDRPGSSPHLNATGKSISNQYYEIIFDQASGEIRSIKDKESGRELLDAKAPYLGNQMIYANAKGGVTYGYSGGGESRQISEYSPKKMQRRESNAGTVKAEYSVWLDDEKTGAAIRQTVTLYDGVKRIDVVNHLEHMKVFAVDHLDRYKNNMFYAFPFAVERGQFRAEYPGGVVRPYKDQLRWGSHDYLYANRWVDVSNADHGITMAPWNAGTFHFGGIRYNQFSIDYEPKNSWLFSYAWSDRMSGLLTLNADDCNATIGYSITSHEGDWNSGDATRFGWSTASPLEVIPLRLHQAGVWKDPARSFLSVDARNVQLTVLKRGFQPGGGWIVRLVETEGKRTDFVLDASALAIERAVVCDLVEYDKDQMAVDSGKMRISIRPYGIMTLRLLSGPVPSAHLELKIVQTTDDSVSLSWSPAGPGRIAYNVYRSDDPAAPPTDYTVVGRTAAAVFVDHGLDLKTRYYYHVAAVSGGNRQGTLSSKVAGETESRNVAPPSPVRELGVIRRSSRSAFVYWRRNHEPDVARYHVYRGEGGDRDLANEKPIATIARTEYFLQTYLDDQLEPGKTYFYKILAEDWASNVQKESPVATVTTPKY